ncbi:AcrB/AcrD/AcrF family protein, partial [Oceanidesulfovibrio marinus]
VKIIPNRERLREADLSTRARRIALEILRDRREIGDFKQAGQRKIDLVVRSSREDIRTPEQLYEALGVTPEGRASPGSSLGAVEPTTGITEILHLNRRPTVTLQVTPPETVPLQSAMDTL